MNEVLVPLEVKLPVGGLLVPNLYSYLEIFELGLNALQETVNPVELMFEVDSDNEPGVMIPNCSVP